MRFRAVRNLAVLAFAAHAVGCQGSSSSPLTPTATNFVKLEIAGPPSVAPGATVAYTATATLGNGSTEDYTQRAAWIASPASVLTISSTGQATGHGIGEATVQANFPAPNATSNCCLTRITVLVLPPDTYRLVGKVLESSLPVTNASVVVRSGTGAGLSVTTDNFGQYRLYGVAGPIEVKVTKAGYNDIVKTVTVTQNDVLDFPEAHQTAPLPPLAGAYTLTLTADPACPTDGQGRPIGPLPDALRTPRSYSASISQDGPLLTVTMTDSSVLAKQNHFTGRVMADVTRFVIGDGYVGYGFDDGVSEQLSTTEVFTFGGVVETSKSGPTLAGALDGAFEVFQAPASGTGFYHLLSQCTATRHQFALTRNAQPAHGH